MKITPHFLINVAAVVLMVTRTVPATADFLKIQDAEKDAEYTCKAEAPTVARATVLGEADWDKNQLACAADMWFALSEAAPKDVTIAQRALLATTAYIDHVNRFGQYEIYGVHSPEWLARIKKATVHGKSEAARLAEFPQDARNLAIRGLYELAWSERLAQSGAPTRHRDAALSQRIIQTLQSAVDLYAGVLKGNALLALTRLYYDLPEFSGGDSAKAVQLLAKANQVAADNPALLCYAAYVDVQQRDLTGATSELSHMRSIEAPSGERQRLADELKTAQGLAARAGDPALQKHLTDKRTKLLAQNTKILPQRSTAVLMHEGVDPFTGQDY